MIVVKRLGKPCRDLVWRRNPNSICESVGQTPQLPGSGSLAVLRRSCAAVLVLVHPLPQGDNLYGVAWTGLRLIAVGSGGSILTAEQDPVGLAAGRIRLPETRPDASRD
jgi:hypothetical protein